MWSRMSVDLSMDRAALEARISLSVCGRERKIIEEIERKVIEEIERERQSKRLRIPHLLKHVGLGFARGLVRSDQVEIYNNHSLVDEVDMITH